MASVLGVSLLASGAAVAAASAVSLDLLSSIRTSDAVTDDEKARNESIAQWGGAVTTVAFAVGAALAVSGLAFMLSDLDPAPAAR